MRNENRIVRVENDELHEYCEMLADLGQCSYQTAFKEIVEKILNGHNLDDNLVIHLAMVQENRKAMKWK